MSAEQEARALFEAHMAAARAVNGEATGEAPSWVGLNEEQKAIWRLTAAARGPGLEGEIEALPNSRERSLAKTYAETARLWFREAPRFATDPSGTVTP